MSDYLHFTSLAISHLSKDLVLHEVSALHIALLIYSYNELEFSYGIIGRLKH